MFFLLSLFKPSQVTNFFSTFVKAEKKNILKKCFFFSSSKRNSNGKFCVTEIYLLKSWAISCQNFPLNFGPFVWLAIDFFLKNFLFFFRFSKNKPKKSPNTLPNEYGRLETIIGSSFDEKNENKILKYT